MSLPPGVRRDRWEDPDRRVEIDAEIAFHIQSKIEELVALGVAPDEARERALKEFGPMASVVDRCEEIQRHRVGRKSRLAALRGFLLEAKATARSLLRSPGFATVAILTFGLGIGATTAVFSLLDGVLLKPLPYRNLDRLVRVWDRDDRRATGQLTIADVGDLAGSSHRFDGFAAFRFRPAVIAASDGESRQLAGAEVFANFFDLLGIRPWLGRTFQTGEDRDGPGTAVVLSFAAWRERFGADSSLIGRTVRINDASRTVIGVLPPEFQNPIGPPIDVWLANDFSAIARDQARARRMHFLSGIARLAPGSSFEAGRAELAVLGDELAAKYPDSNKDHRPYVKPLQEAGAIAVRPMLLMVAAAVGCLLLITCANLANLVFARALARSREFSLRSALGAGRGRIVRTVLVEQLGLAALGAGLGLGVAAATVGAARSALGPVVPRLDRVAIDGRAFGVAASLAVVAALLSGLVPALLAVGRAGGLATRAGLTRRSVRGRDALLAVQAALAAMLLVAAGLTAKSLSRLLDTQLGFVTERVWTFQVPMSPARYPDQAAIDRTRSELLEKIRALPGVVSASASYGLPMQNASTTSFLAEGSLLAKGQAPEVGYNAADGDYFRTLGIPLVEGRTFEARDRADAPPVVIVNEALARRYFPGRSAVGTRIKSGPGLDGPWVEIVGVVGDIRRQSPAVAPEPELYFSIAQDLTRQPSYSVRIAGDPGPVVASIRARLGELDPGLPMASVAPLDRIIGQTTQQPRTLATVLIGFSVLALVIAAVGIYGVISFLVAERRREIAVRLAVGASEGRLLLETTRRGLTPLLVGLGAGIGLAFLSSSVVRRFLFEVAPTDPATYLLVIAAVAGAGLLGALVPAARASKVPPASVLRD